MSRSVSTIRPVFRLSLLCVALSSVFLSACGGSSSGGTDNTPTCTEQGVSSTYACKTGSTEPLYTYQWALQASNSFFAAFPSVFGPPLDLNVEPAHTQGIKGQGVNVMVLDDGLDVTHEDLVANVDRAMTNNFVSGSNDPTPSDVRDAHGTHVGGIIAAAQNGLGVVGIAPRARLGGSNLIANDMLTPANSLLAYGGAEWSKRTDVFNGSYGLNPETPSAFDTADGNADNLILRSIAKLRGGKGAVAVRSAGNEFKDFKGRNCPAEITGQISCENPVHDPVMLEPTVIVAGATNAKGVKSSYSNAGPALWVAGYGGEYGGQGTHGQGDGPTIFSTDLQGCTLGYSRTVNLDPEVDTITDFLTGKTTRNGKAENPNCHYGYMNGTSAGAPTISGVVALMLSANPNLTWRDIRDILRLSARQIDPNYGSRDQRGFLLDLRSGTFTTQAVGTANYLVEGSPLVRVEYGWQTNAAGQKYANWYGFGVPDAAKAVELAKARTQYLPAALTMPDFSPAFAVSDLKYGQVQKLGTFTVSSSGQVDALQLRLSGSYCVGSLGLLVKSPSGTVSLVANPFNIYYKTGVAESAGFGLGSYTFHGENAKGVWTVYGLNAQPGLSELGAKACTAQPSVDQPLSVEFRILPKAL